jgi:branched-chain amino acid transport system substrate-binding protein
MAVVACARGTLNDFLVPRKVEPVVKQTPTAPAATVVPRSKVELAPASLPKVPVSQSVARLPSTEPAAPSLNSVALLDVDPGRVRVALLLPLSGQSSALGQAMLRAAELALFEIGNDTFDLLPFDTLGTQEGAAIVAESAVRQQVSLILGPLLAPAAAAVAPIARRAGVNVLSFSNSREIAGKGMFILGFVPRQQVETIMEYAARLDHTRFAVLAPDNPYGTAVIDALSEAAAARSVFVTKVVRYAPGAADMSAEIKRLANFDDRRAVLLAQRAELTARGDEISHQALRRLERLDTIGDVDFDAILLPEGGQALRTLASLLSFYDVDQPSVRLLGIRAWDEFHDLGTEPALVGAWFAAPPLAERTKFEKWYAEAFARTPPRLASIAYDATALAAILAGRGQTPDFSLNTLTNKDGFLGLDGVFRLHPDGRVQRAYAVIEVRRDGFRTLQSAPQNFQKLTN